MPYLGVELEDALSIAERIDIQTRLADGHCRSPIHTSSSYISQQSAKLSPTFQNAVLQLMSAIEIFAWERIGPGMGRRYLTTNEVEAALSRGKTIECFVGPFSSDDRKGVRHLTLRTTGIWIEVNVFETADLGSPDFLDLGEFGPVNSDVEFGNADLEMKFDDLAACFSCLERSWPGCTQAMVNEGIVQDEYADYLARAAES